MPELTIEQLAETFKGTPDAFTPPEGGGTPPADKPIEQQPNTPAPGDNPPEPAPENKEAAPSGAAQPQFNFDDELVRSTGGSLKSKDELVALLEKAKVLPDLESRIKTFETENADLKSKVNADPFANDYLRKMNDLIKGGASDDKIQAFQTLNKINIDELPPLDARSLALQMKHGLTAEEAKLHLYRKYDVDPADPTAVLSPEALIDLKIDSQVDRDYLKTYKAEVSSMPTPEDKAAQQQQLFEQEQAQRIAAVEPIAKAVAADVIATAFKDFSINGLEGDKAVKIDLPLSDENKATLTEAALNYIKNYDIKANDEGKAKIAAFIKNSAWIANGQKWVIEAANQRELQIRALYDNPTGKINRGQANPNATTTSEQKRIQNIREAIGLNN